MRVARELHRLAKAERRIVPYLLANFHLMNLAQGTFEVDLGVETAIETIALLESEEKARQFQPDFPEEPYYYTVHWMSACAYDNLGKHIAERDGYNSDGVHDVINEGIEVCRRTGKLECVACFREYAGDVFLAANDLEMSLHHARTITGMTPEAGQVDRRWPAAKQIAALLMLNGQLEDAWEAAVEALRLARSYHTPTEACTSTWVLLDEILRLLGRPEDLEALCRGAGCPYDPGAFPSEDEAPVLDLVRAQRDAVAACCHGEPGRALEILAPWDKRLQQLNAFHSWIEVRLRLAAAAQLAGDLRRMKALAEPLEARVRKAREWQALARLRGLLEGTMPPCPVPMLAPATSGPFAAVGAAAKDAAREEPPSRVGAASASERLGTAPPERAAPVPEVEAMRPHTPMTPAFERWIDQFRQAEGRDDVYRAVLDEMLAVRPEDVSEPDDAARLIYLAEHAARLSNRAAEAWRWAEPLARRFPQHGTTLNVLAELGNTARHEAGEQGDEVVAIERLESLFRASLDLDCEHARNFGRAGFFYLDIGKRGDAERCLARGFRLDRTDSPMALALADLYCESERPRDALAVLDMCLREGCEDPRVASQAGLTAVQLARYDAALAYFDRFEQLDPGQTWTNYYRALALLETDRASEALGAIQTEAERFGRPGLHLEVLRAWAHSKLGDLESFRRHLAQALAMRLVEADYLTDSGVARLFEKLYLAAKCLPDDAPEHEPLRRLMLASGMAPDALFDDERRRHEAVEGLNFYVYRLRQPLDAGWKDSLGCRPGQEAWTEYVAHWGVLARHSGEAEQAVLAWQARCYPLPAEVVDFNLQYEDCHDSPGVVWQGPREGAVRR
jgi:tetratricopeptide (TPR) repeat protein